MASGGLTPQLSGGDGYGQRACPDQLMELQRRAQALWRVLVLVL